MCNGSQSMHHAKAIMYCHICMKQPSMQTWSLPGLLRSNDQPLYSPVRLGCHLESKVVSTFALDPSADAAAAQCVDVDICSFCLNKIRGLQRLQRRMKGEHPACTSVGECTNARTSVCFVRLQPTRGSERAEQISRPCGLPTIGGMRMAL